MKSWWWLTDLLKSVNISENMVFRKWLFMRALTSPIDSSIYDWRDEWAVLRWDIVTGISLLLAGNYYVGSFVPACLPANPMDFLSKNSQQHSQPTMGSNCEPKYIFLPSQLSLLAVLQTNKIFNFFQFPFNNLGTLVIYLKRIRVYLIDLFTVCLPFSFTWLWENYFHGTKCASV